MNEVEKGRKTSHDLLLKIRAVIASLSASEQLPD